MSHKLEERGTQKARPKTTRYESKGNNFYLGSAAKTKPSGPSSKRDHIIDDLSHDNLSENGVTLFQSELSIDLSKEEEA